jgi:hypothetical protein
MIDQLAPVRRTTPFGKIANGLSDAICSRGVIA